MTPGRSVEAAIKLHQAGQLAEAEAIYAALLADEPNHVDALHYLGVLRHQQNRTSEALVLLDRASAATQATAFHHSNYAVILHKIGRLNDALALTDRALSIRPDLVQTLCNRGNVLTDLGRPDKAVESYNRAIRLKPDYADAHTNRGNALRLLKDFASALESYDLAVKFAPTLADAHNNRANTLADLNRLEAALESYDRAIALSPAHVLAICNRASVLKRLGRLDEALAGYDLALESAPLHFDALLGRGHALAALDRDDEAIASYERARSVRPGSPYALDALAMCARAACDWNRTSDLEFALIDAVNSGDAAPSPFTFLTYCDDPALQLKCAQMFAEQTLPVWQPVRSRTAAVSDRIRIAYLSADFHEHATAYLAAELFERHDRSRFEIVGISYGKNDGSATRNRLVAAFDRFENVPEKSDQEIAARVSELDVHIAVDLKGHTADSRLGIFGYRPAPIQVSYLGYPGTAGVDFFDYVIADRFVLPFDQQPFFTERIVHLPDSYQVNDSKRVIADSTSSREEEGLPAEGFVFCCFNNNYKITKTVFDIWGRILQATPGSVLWLLRGNHAAARNLNREASIRGVNPDRLVFAERKPLDQHLARHRHADLFLDTLPVNAHTTASDALWAGLSVLTCRGRSFAGRVASSLLHAAGLPELITDDLAQYEQMALRLARDPELLGVYRARANSERQACALFDTGRFVRNLEKAYVRMLDQQLLES
ncbi:MULTISPECIES: tetratricopeptide repeat protein [Bradyrhizobium]|uniref:O-linked N-acetylglucosamine transferase, SPINDLY family protein n=1 Tax=Bradyrhizobium TaxID=374 RepID=UPI001ED9E36A|nr:glycosyltransferase family 41 protein [Bradyrhizobium zhengyangense]MCG2645515.1 tetratricopeptide repeat protein [Bradyrhizobium zhengyangense]